MAGMWLSCISCPSSTADVRHMSVTFLPALSPAAGHSKDNPQTKDKPLILKNIVNINKSRIWTGKRPCVSLNNRPISRERSVIAVPQRSASSNTLLCLLCLQKTNLMRKIPGGSLIKRTDVLIQVISLPVSDKSTYIDSLGSHLLSAHQCP